MTRWYYELEEADRHDFEIDKTKRMDNNVRRMLAALRGGLPVRIGAIVHGHDRKAGLPCTACGVRWVPGYPLEGGTFPQGVPTDDEVDCMTCLVRMTGP